jgi:hypothetical protein
MRSSIHISYFLATTFFIAVLKQIFQESRPVWFNGKIDRYEWFCPKDFGNPSGHSFAVFPLYEPILTDIIGYGKFRFAGLILIILGFIVPISRMYLGVHSANQIIIGMTIGVIFLTMYRFKLQETLYNLYCTFLTKSTNLFYLFFVVLSQLICTAIPIIVFQINIDNRPMEIRDLENLNLACGTSLTGLQVQGKMLTSCSIIGLVFGIIYGFLICNNARDVWFFSGKWEYKSKKACFFHNVALAISAGLPALIFTLALPYVISNEIVKFIVM